MRLTVESVAKSEALLQGMTQSTRALCSALDNALADALDNDAPVDELMQARQAAKDAETFIARAASAIMDAKERLVASRPYADYHQETYGCEPLGMLQ